MLSADERHLVLWQGAREVAERVNVGLQTFAGTWIYDQTKGMKYFQEIFDNPAPVGLQLLRAEAWRVISETAGIKEVLRVDTDFIRETRTAVVTWAAVAEGGLVESEVSFG